MRNFNTMEWLALVIPLLVLLSNVVTANQKEGCTPIDVADIAEAADCSKMIYDFVNKTSKGLKLSANSKFKIIEEFDYDVKTQEGRRAMIPEGHFLKAVIAQTEDEESPTTMFCFMGTKSDEQLDIEKNNGLHQTCIDPDRGIRLKEKECNENENSVKVFTYDWLTFKRFNKFIKGKFVPLVKEGRKYIITGHSLGGALSSLLTLRTTTMHNGAVWKNKQSSLITFGQPRVGNRKFARLIDERIPAEQKLRFIYHKDTVPQVPPRIGEEDAYTHHSREIYITNELQGTDDEWVICPLGDTFTCGNNWMFDGGSDDDHDMALYLQSVKNLIASTDKVSRFLQEQCLDGDSTNLKEIKKLRDAAADVFDDDFEDGGWDDDDDDDFEDDTWKKAKKKKAKKAKGKGNRTKKSKEKH